MTNLRNLVKPIILASVLGVVAVSIGAIYNIFFPHIGNGYYFYSIDYERWISKKDPVTKKETRVIDSYILDVSYINSYVLVIRQPQNTIKTNQSITNYEYPNLCEYWVINKNSDEVFGPSNEGSFLSILADENICVDCSIENIFKSALGSSPSGVPDSCLKQIDLIRNRGTR